MKFSFAGLSAQSESAAAAAAGLLPPMNIQNLAALAAMTQPSIQAAQQPSAQLSNAAALICKYLTNIFNGHISLLPYSNIHFLFTAVSLIRYDDRYAHN